MAEVTLTHADLLRLKEIRSKTKNAPGDYGMRFQTAEEVIDYVDGCRTLIGYLMDRNAELSTLVERDANFRSTLLDFTDLLASDRADREAQAAHLKAATDRLVGDRLVGDR